MKKNTIFFIVFILCSCNNQKKTGIEGHNNSNNTVIIADKVEVPLDEEARKYKFNYSITSSGVAGISLGESIDEVQKFFHRNTNFRFKTDEGARNEGTDFDFPTIYIIDSVSSSINDAIFSLRSDMKKINGFEVYSSKFRTYNGIHVGMSVSELSELYQDNLMLDADLLNEREIFIPFDLQGSKSIMYLYISRGSDNDSSILKSGMNYQTASNYEKIGFISSILIIEGGDS